MGGGKKQKAPAAPNYEALQESDALANRQTAQELTRWNRPTQIDALGNTLNWYEDPNGNWTQQVNLHPDVRQAQVQGLWGYRNALADIQDTGKFQGVGDEYVREAYNNAVNANGDFNPNAYGAIGEFDRSQGDRVAADMYESAMSRLRPEQARTKEALDVKLRQQGLQPGTEAFNRAMQNEMTSQGDVTAKLGLDSTAAGYNAARDIYASNLAGQGQRFNQGLSGYEANTAQDWSRFQAASKLQNDQFNQAYTKYNAPLEKAQIMAQLNAAAPGANFAGFGTATGYSPADMTGAANMGYQARMGNANASQGKKNSMMGAGATLGAGYLMSDIALKENVVPLQGRAALEAVMRLGGYEYDWRDGSGHDSGVIAQQVLEVLPDLTALAATGRLAVNYTGLVALLTEAVKYLAEGHHGLQ